MDPATAAAALIRTGPQNELVANQSELVDRPPTQPWHSGSGAPFGQGMQPPVVQSVHGGQAAPRAAW